MRDWAANQLQDHRDEQQVLLIPPGSHTLPQNAGHWLISSSNFEGLEPGQELQGPCELFVQGRLPGRLIAQPNGWPPSRLPAAMVVDAPLDSDSLEVLEL